MFVGKNSQLPYILAHKSNSHFDTDFGGFQVDPIHRSRVNFQKIQSVVKLYCYVNTPSDIKTRHAVQLQDEDDVMR